MKRIELILKNNELNFVAIDNPQDTFNCLESFKMVDKHVIIIDNPAQTNMYIINSHHDAYHFIGIDQENQTVTTGILSKNTSKGLDITSIADRKIIIFKSKLMVDQFCSRW